MLSVPVPAKQICKNHLKLLLFLYEIHCEIEAEKSYILDQFLPFGELLLADFNLIDQYNNTKHSGVKFNTPRDMMYENIRLEIKPDKRPIKPAKYKLNDSLKKKILGPTLKNLQKSITIANISQAINKEFADN